MDEAPSKGQQYWKVSQDCDFAKKNRFHETAVSVIKTFVDNLFYKTLCINGSNNNSGIIECSLPDEILLNKNETYNL